MTSKAGLYLLPSDFFYNLEVWSAVRPPVGMEGVGGVAYDVANMEGVESESDSVAHIESMEGTVDGETRAAQTPPPFTSATPAPTESEGASNIPVYVSFTISDGDNLQYDQHRMYHLWQDTARGSIPLGWTISPALIEAAPTLAAYYRGTATRNDELVAGPSGAAYMWPSSWPAQHLDTFLRETGELMRRMNLRTIQVLDGALSRLFPFRPWQEYYARSLSRCRVRGILVNDSYRHGGWRVVAGVPVVKNLGLAKSVAQTLALIKNNTPPQLKSPVYLNVYIYAWSMTPSDIRKVMQSLDDRYTIVTPGQLCALIARTREQA
jgi:putative glycoside hydrolase with GxGYxYP motif